MTAEGPVHVSEIATGDQRRAVADATTDAILDAARACVLDFGFRRTTLSDVARRAGISRVTVYRRYPDLDAVVRDLMTREFGTLMVEVEASVEGGDGRERAATRTAETVRALRAHPVLRKVMEAEPELMLPYMIGHVGSTQRNAALLLGSIIAEGQAEGSIRAGDTAEIARTVMLIAQAFVMWGEDDEDAAEDRLVAELRHAVEASLRPS
jgi:AcrR family transcriptional regulator